MAEGREALTETTTVVVGERSITVAPISYRRYMELQRWAAEHRTDPEESGAGDRAEYVVEYAVKCLQYGCPNENWTEDEAITMFRKVGGIEGHLVQMALAACGNAVEMEVGAATQLPT